VGRPLVQPSEFADVETGPHEGGLGQADAVNIWRGVLITAERAFRPDDDVCKLLRMLAKTPGVLDESHGSRWPVGRLITILNAKFSPPPWSDDRVENAKKRLLNWVQRLMRQNGLDATDLEGVFARVARQKVQQRMPVMESSERNLQS
jgi:hypothetical protein